MDERRLPFFFQKIFLPTDFSKADHDAFLHALAIVWRAKSHLRILHVAGSQERPDWDSFPKVRETLERWGCLKKGSLPVDIADLGISVHKILEKEQSILDSILDHLERHPVSFMVLAPHIHKGVSAFFHQSLSAHIARVHPGVCLFVPEAAKGFVNGSNGQLKIKRILFPVDFHPDPHAALRFGQYFAELMGETQVQATALYVSEEEGSFPCSLPHRANWHWSRLRVPGNPVQAILHVARFEEHDLIVMPTEGRHGLLDALRGSTTERIVLQAPCPVLTISSKCLESELVVNQASNAVDNWSCLPGLA